MIKISEYGNSLLEKDPKWMDLIMKKLRSFLHKHSVPRWAMFSLDTLAVYLTFIIAYILRFNPFYAGFHLDLAMKQGLVALVIYSGFGLLFKSYTGLIRHTTIKDIFNVFVSTTFSLLTLSILSLAARFAFANKEMTIPLSVIVIHYVSITVLMFFVRMGIKMFFELISNTFGKKKNVLIFGAGSMGVIVMDVIENDKKNRYRIAGFMDNNKRLRGKEINGIPVYHPGVVDQEFLAKHNVWSLIFAIKKIDPEEKREIIRNVVELGMEVLDIPDVDRWLNGQLNLVQFQRVKLVDLLGRDPIKLNREMLMEELEDKVILVTGAAGSIGSEIVRQLARFSARRVILVDQAETPMFHLQNELKEKVGLPPMKCLIADVTCQEKMRKIFEEDRPDIVYHAAAYKHVPLLEENPHEAFRVNVGGVRILSKLSVEFGVKKFVMVSSDKAVNPANVMGATKRVCEMVVQANAEKREGGTQFVITRFGNVLGSSGSVIPLFTRQIEQGGPVTVTHPDITRYFMTIPEACELVLEAGFIGRGGEIFVFDMGEPIRIVDLARQMIRLSGLEPGKDIMIEITGLRPGEKLFEELLADEENTIPTHHPKIKIAQVAGFDHSTFCEHIERHLGELYTYSRQGVVDILEDLVPEYKSSNEEYNGNSRNHTKNKSQ